MRLPFLRGREVRRFGEAVAVLLASQNKFLFRDTKHILRRGFAVAVYLPTVWVLVPAAGSCTREAEATLTR
jgi:hypothetical protein